jgi:hypothetical protein
MDGRVKTLHPKVHGAPAGPARPPRRRDARTRDRRPRSSRLQPLPLRGNGREGRLLRGRDRKHRRRRPGDDSRRGQEPRMGDRDRRSGGLRGGARGNRRRRRELRNAAAPRPDRLRPHRRL